MLRSSLRVDLARKKLIVRYFYGSLDSYEKRHEGAGWGMNDGYELGRVEASLLVMSNVNGAIGFFHCFEANDGNEQAGPNRKGVRVFLPTGCIGPARVNTSFVMIYLTVAS